MGKFTFAIMGATGHIGHVLAEELLKKGHKVRALGRDKHKLQELKSKGAEIISGDFTDHALLSKAFRGCHAIFSFIPPAYTADDFEVFQDLTSEAIVQAIAKEKISHVLNLSSIGANLPSGTGPIKGLHHHEERLDMIPHLNVLHFRPGFFMENLLGSLAHIKSSKVIATPLEADLSIPMVATQDIGLKMAEFLDALTFTGSSIFEFIGPQAITMAEAAKIIGKAIKKPDLKYKKLSYEEAEKEMRSSGMTHQISKLMIEMYRAMNEGKMMPTKPMTAKHKGKITFEELSKTFSHMVHSAKKAA